MLETCWKSCSSARLYTTSQVSRAADIQNLLSAKPADLIQILQSELQILRVVLPARRFFPFLLWKVESLCFDCGEECTTGSCTVSSQMDIKRK